MSEHTTGLPVDAELTPIPFEASRIVAPADKSILPFPPEMAQSRLEVAKAPICFEKTLTHSDTSGGGRIVIPKAIAEQHFPTIGDQQGCQLPVVDVFGETRWLRFRYWVNNSSRMYILEGVGPLLKLFKLSVGDVLMFGKDSSRNLVICGRKGTKGDTARKPPSTHSRKKKRDAYADDGDTRMMIQHAMVCRMYKSPPLAHVFTRPHLLAADDGRPDVASSQVEESHARRDGPPKCI